MIGVSSVAACDDYEGNRTGKYSDASHTTPVEKRSRSRSAIGDLPPTAQETVRPTAHHKFYSEPRDQWLSAEDLQPGETLRGLTGPLQVVSQRPVPGTHRVYNMTVEAEHVYHVSTLGVLAHNMCAKASRTVFNEYGVTPGRNIDLDAASGANNRSYITYVFKDSAGDVVYVGRGSGPGTPRHGRDLGAAFSLRCTHSKHNTANE